MMVQGKKLAENVSYASTVHYTGMIKYTSLSNNKKSVSIFKRVKFLNVYNVLIVEITPLKRISERRHYDDLSSLRYEVTVHSGVLSAQ